MRKTTCFLLAAAAFAAASAVTSCGLVDIEDIDKINTEITLAPGTEFPIISEKTFTLKELISADASGGTFSISEDGEYSISYSLDPKTVGGFTLDAGKFKLNASGSFNEAVSLTEAEIPANTPLVNFDSGDAAAKSALEAYLALQGISVNLDFFQNMLSQEFKLGSEIDFSIADFPGQIKTFKKADLDGSISFSLVPAGIPFKQFTLKQGASFTFPEFFVFNSCSNTDFEISGGHVLVAKKDVAVPFGTGLSFVLGLQSLDGGNGISAGGNLALKGAVAVDGNISIDPADFTGDTSGVSYLGYEFTLVKDATSLGNLTVACNYTAADVTLKNATVQLSKDALPSFDGDFGFDVDKLPAFLSDSDANIELAEVRVNLDLDSSLPFDFNLKAQLAALTGTTENHKVNIGPLDFPANRKTHYTIDDEELGKILSPVPTRVEARNFEIGFDESQWITVESGQEYGGTFAVGVEAPISFTANTRLTLGVDENFDVDLGVAGDVIKGETPVEIKFTAKNSIPLNFAIEVEALDASKKAIPGVKSSLNSPVGAGSLQSPTTTDVVVSITLPADSKIIKGIGLKMSAYTDDVFAGTRLNQNQSITLKDVKAGLPNGIKTDVKDLLK